MELDTQLQFYRKRRKKKIWKVSGLKVEELRKLKILSLEDKEMLQLVISVEIHLVPCHYKNISKPVKVDQL